MPKYPPRAPAVVTAWIVLCAFCNCTGWILSAFRQLNAVGYTIAFGIGLAVLIIWRHQIFPERLRPLSLARFRRRFRRLFPLCFLILASLAILGGVLHAPSNYDALAYRVPRMFHWLAHGQWHWIHTGFPRVNTRACGVEWLSAPLIVLLRTERWLFAINAASYLLLPGLIFSLFRRVSVSPRVAWHWMWLAPSAYCYVLQAGSIANDMFSAVFALAAVDYALRARKSGRVSEASLSVLSAALLTGAKSSNLPLLLPWLIAFLPLIRMWLKRPMAALLTVIAAAAASFVPTAALNIEYCGDWSGQAAEHVRIGGGPMWLHLANNGIVYTLENLTPPVFPFASDWNRAATKIIPPALAARLDANFEPAAAHWALDELQIEEAAGWGFGLTILLALSVAIAVLRRKRGHEPCSRETELGVRFVRLAPWVSLLFVTAKLGISGGARYLAPYYLLVAMGLLQYQSHCTLVRQKWWRTGAIGTMALAAMLLVVSPARPLWPARWFCRHFASQLQSSQLGAHMLAVYEVYGARPDAFAPVVNLLPADASVLGLVTYDDPEASLWHPLWVRQLEHVTINESAESVRRRGIKYVLAKEDLLAEPWTQWLNRMNARSLLSIDLNLRASVGPRKWRLAELLSPAPEPSRSLN